MTRLGPAYWIGAVLWSVLLHAAAVAWYLWPDDLPQREGAPTGRGIVIGLSPSDAVPAARSGAAHARATSQPSPAAPSAPTERSARPPLPTPQDRPQEARRAPAGPVTARPSGETVPRTAPAPSDAPRQVAPAPLPSVKPAPPPRPASPARASQASPSGAPTARRSEDSSEARQALGSIDSYLGTIRRWLERHKRYPDVARANGEEGIVKVRFRLRRTGHVRALGVVATSGSWILDQEAIDTIRRSVPFPTFPASVTDDELAVVVDVKFSLH